MQQLFLIIDMSHSCLQVSDELQQKEVSNDEKENSIKMKRQTIDLLPDTETNLLKLQVHKSHAVYTCITPVQD